MPLNFNLYKTGDEHILAGFLVTLTCTYPSLVVRHDALEASHHRFVEVAPGDAPSGAQSSNPRLEKTRVFFRLGS